MMAPGFNLKWPRPIENVIIVDAKQARATSDQVRMLTKDENIVLVDFNVQYTVADPQHFLFSVREPDETIKQAAESAVREVIGASDLSSIMPDQLTQSDVESKTPTANPSAELAGQSMKVLQATLDRYDTGLAREPGQFPERAPAAGSQGSVRRRDQRARGSPAQQQRGRRLRQARDPEARGEAARILAEAEGYKAERVAKAQGDASAST